MFLSLAILLASAVLLVLVCRVIHPHVEAFLADAFVAEGPAEPIARAQRR